MKNLYLFSLLFVSMASLAYQNEPDGFRGIPWGDAYENKQSELKLYQEGKSNFYSRDGDKLEIGGAELKDIYYGYYKNRLSVVVIHTEGSKNRYALLDALKEQFGKGHQPNRYIDDYYWFGKVTDISYDCNSINKKCTVFMRSKLMQNDESAEDKAKAQGAAKDF